MEDFRSLYSDWKPTYLDANSFTHTNGERYANDNTYSDLNPNPITFADPDCYTNTTAFADTDGNANASPNLHTPTDFNSTPDGYPLANGYVCEPLGSGLVVFLSRRYRGVAVYKDDVRSGRPIGHYS